MIRPVPLAEPAVHNALCRCHNLPKQRFRLFRRPALSVQFPVKRSGRKGFRQQIPQAFPLCSTFRPEDFFRLIRLQAVSNFLHAKRIIAVWLNQAVEGLYTLASRERCEENITPSVLVHVAEIAVALRVELRQHTEIIVVPLQIAVFSGIHVEDLVIRQLNGIAAPQHVVHISVLTVRIEIRIRGLRPDMPAQFRHQTVSCLFLPVIIRSIQFLTGKLCQKLLALHLSDQLVEYDLAPGRQIRLYPVETARNQILIHLRLRLQITQTMLDKANRFLQRQVIGKYHFRICNRL